MKKSLVGDVAAPICRHCNKPLKPLYHRVYVDAEKAALSFMYLTDVPKVGDVIGQFQVRAVVQVKDSFRRLVFRVWYGEWGGWAGKFCDPTHAAYWAAVHAK